MTVSVHPDDPLVSIGLPVRNGAGHVSAAIDSALRQTYGNLELVVSDNASTDETEAVCREFVRSDARVRYHRRPTNIGLINNFNATFQLARGEFFCWLGDDDLLDDRYLERGVGALRSDDRLVLVTTDTSVRGPDGQEQRSAYVEDGLRSGDPLVRIREMLRLLNGRSFSIDPISAIVRRGSVLSIPMRNMLRSDQVFAVELALAGPWGHVPEVLAYTNYDDVKRPDLARRLGVPVWHARCATARQGRELFRVIAASQLTTDQKRRARASVLAWYSEWHRRRTANKLHSVLGVGSRAAAD